MSLFCTQNVNPLTWDLDSWSYFYTLHNKIQKKTLSALSNPDRQTVVQKLFHTVFSMIRAKLIVPLARATSWCLHMLLPLDSGPEETRTNPTCWQPCLSVLNADSNVMFERLSIFSSLECVCIPSGPNRANQAPLHSIKSRVHKHLAWVRDMDFSYITHTSGKNNRTDLLAMEHAMLISLNQKLPLPYLHYCIVLHILACVVWFIM